MAYQRTKADNTLSNFGCLGYIFILCVVLANCGGGG